MYAVIIKVYLFLFPQKQNKESHSKFSVAILVACFNEEDFIEDKINNLLQLTYDQELLEFVFITDGSTDRTKSIVEKYQLKHPKLIKLFHEDARNGKQHAINRVMPLLNSEIVVFNDCNTIINKDAIENLVRHFNNKGVGVVNGEKKIIVDKNDDAVSAGEGMYWKYESTLKKIDSDFYTSVGSAGELFAIRRELYMEVPKEISIEDFYLSMQIVLSGFRNVYEPHAYAQEYSSFNLSEEFKRKRRISAGAFKTMVTLKEIYSFKHIKVLFLYLSHRVFRWTLAPISMVLLLVSNLFLESTFFRVVLFLQVLFYVLAFLGFLFRNNKTKWQIIFVPFYFVFMNVALFVGFLDFLKNTNHTVWEKAERKMK